MVNTLIHTVTQHLICDPVDETCICDSATGFVHRKDLEYQYQLGMPYDDSSKICISLTDIAESTERLLGLKKDVEIDPQPVPDERLRHPEPIHDNENEAFLDLQLEEEEIEEAEGESSVENLHDLQDDSFRQIDVANVYADFMKKMGAEEVSNYDEDRLKQFRVQRKPIDLEELSFNKLILDELLKYRVGSLDLFEWKDSLKKMIDIHLMWTDNKLADSICSIVFDVDHDKLFTHQEYVISILSQNIRELVTHKVFFEAGMDYFRTTIDPMPEEMYVRRVIQNERLVTNWQLIDKDGDGHISKVGIGVK